MTVRIRGGVMAAALLSSTALVCTALAVPNGMESAARSARGEAIGGAGGAGDAATVAGARTHAARSYTNAGTSALGRPSPDRSATDWSTALVDSTLARYTPDKIGGWSYPVGLYLYGQYLVYQRTHQQRYLDYIKQYVDRFVDSNGTIDQSFNSLDSMQAGRLLVILHHETGAHRYQIAAQKIRKRLDSYPRTADGGFWHATSSSRAHQLWADGVYMVTPFLIEYGKEFRDSAYTEDEAARQLAVYGGHLQRTNGLLRHAYDESKTADWADKKTGQAPEHWCRAVGWYAMADVTVLDALPADHPRRAQLTGILRKLAIGLEKTQDPSSGRWFQVMDKGERPDNWTETSCSSMFAFALSRGVQRGYLDRRYAKVAKRAYDGVLQRISLGSDGRTHLSDITIGTNVGDYGYYIDRTRATNDFHGLGAFLIMFEQLRAR
ncbi:glycoside hydrolase family 88/105 protein [Streptomyces inhibens]|nr:glycoside hydrolase family 88 protein [Streptomyces inhibens]